MRAYVVQRGDNLMKIARMFLRSESRWMELAKLNGIKRPEILQAGETILLPDEIKTRQTNAPMGQHPIYYVRYGDTLSSIARTYLGDGNRWMTICQLNGLQNPNQLFVGQPLKMPMGTKLDVERPSFKQKQPSSQKPATETPAKVHLFLVADEWDPTRKKVVRRIAVPDPKVVTDKKLFQRIINPETFGIYPRDASSNVTVGRHLEGHTRSKFISVSERWNGSPRFPGKRYWIDFQQVIDAGGTVHESEEILNGLRDVMSRTKDPEKLGKLKEVLHNSPNVDKEILLGFEQGKGIPAKAVKGAKAIALTRGAQVVSGVGIVLTANDLRLAGERSYETGSIRPLAAESVRQAGGWGGAIAGAEIGAGVGALVGIETGPGAVVTAAVGSVIFAVAGYFGADWLAGYIDIHEEE